MSSKVTYRQQHTRCGKGRCRKCKEGAGHGPYWYAFWSENGRTVSRYIGVHLPDDIEIERQSVRKAENKHELSLALASNQAGVYSPSVDAAVPLQLSTQVLRIYVLGQFRIDRLRSKA
jgi:hypothetical protein